MGRRVPSRVRVGAGGGNRRDGWVAFDIATAPIVGLSLTLDVALTLSGFDTELSAEEMGAVAGGAAVLVMGWRRVLKQWLN